MLPPPLMADAPLAGSGRLAGWGSTSGGLLGCESTGESLAQPRLLDTPPGWRPGPRPRVLAAQDSILALGQHAGSAFAAGRNYGFLGRDMECRPHTYVPTRALSGLEVRLVVLSSYHLAVHTAQHMT